jgi:hypothetical protein
MFFYVLSVSISKISPRFSKIESSALEHSKARNFVFILVLYEKIEFSKELTSSFSKTDYKKKFCFFKKAGCAML